jgi:uncharacterized protein YodC (DUF2158 family)
MRWRMQLFGPVPKFKIGDRVQLARGGNFMLVTEIISFAKMREPLIQCKWYEPESRMTKTHIFPQRKLTFFNGKVLKKARMTYTASEAYSF